MSNLFVHETFLEVRYDNCGREERWGLGESGVYETNCTTPGELFRASQAEYGRCTGKIYVGDGKHVGWVFLGRQPYEDSPSQTYLREVWVSIRTAPDTVTREPHYATASA